MSQAALTYTLSLQDKMSAGLAKIGIAGETALDKFVKLEKQSSRTKRILNEMGGSIGALRAKVDLLKAEREWIPQSSIKSLRITNSEIKRLEKQIRKLETINGSKLKTWFKDAFNQVPFGNFLTNPLVMGGLAAGRALKLGIQKQMMTTSFEVLLNGKGAAQKLLADIKAYSAKTPYQILGLGDNAKMMLSFGIKQDEVMPYLKAIGDIAMGDSGKMQSLTLAFSQMSSTGKLMGQDLLQMINAGFNPLEEISRKTGIGIGELKEKMAKGQISAKMVQDAFMSATKEGGKFYKMSEKMSQTIGGRLSTAMDKLNNVFLSVFNILEPVVSLGLDLAITLLGYIAPALNYVVGLIRDGNPVVLTLIGLVGTLTALYYAEALALKVKSTWLKITDLWTKRNLVTQKLKAVWDRIVAGTTLVWAGAQAVLNAVMSANPIGLIIIAVAALTTGIIWLVNKVKGWGEAWHHTVKGAKLIFKAYVLYAKLLWTGLVNGLAIGLNKIQIAYYKFKNAVGLGDSSENQRMIDKLTADTEKRAKAIVDAAKKLKDATIEAKEEFAKAAGSLHWKASEEAGKAFHNPLLGISKPSLPFASTPGHEILYNDHTKKNEGKKTNRAIATGGTKTTNINIQLRTLIEQMIIKGRDFKDSNKQMERQTADALMRVLAMATTTGN